MASSPKGENLGNGDIQTPEPITIPLPRVTPIAPLSA